MSKNSAIDRQTLEAYRRTRYRVCVVPPWDLRVDVVSAELIAAQARRGVACSAFVTACNPLGRLTDAAANIVQQQALRSEIERLRLGYLPGLGEDPGGVWPAEASFLVFGLHLDAAQALGRQFRQNAILWSGADGRPELVLLR